MKVSIVMGIAVTAVLAGVLPAQAGPAEDISTALGQGKAVFLVVTETGAQGTENAIQIAQQAQALVPASAVALLDRGAAANQPLVEKYRVLGAPVPLVLVIASNGVVAGGALLKDATPPVLAKMVPTPKKAEWLLHLSQKVPVFVVLSRPTMTEQTQVFEACTQAVQRLERKAATVVVNLDDPAEKALLEEMKIDRRETVPTTVVWNVKGQKTGMFRGVVTADQLVEAARKQAPCCPGGSC